jgi:hypothetical protein
MTKYTTYIKCNHYNDFKTHGTVALDSCVSYPTHIEEDGSGG